MGCIYCPAPANSLEHPLPAAFGEFKYAPYLRDRICRRCNNQSLGVLDEQLTRSGPEALLRRFYGIQGRATHDTVNIFQRGSAGGHRVDLRGMDKALGYEVALEIENGQARQMCQIIFFEKSGKAHHLPIRKSSTPEELRAAYAKLGVVQPCEDMRIFYGPDEKDWVEALIHQAWPSVTFGEGKLGSTSYQGAVGTVTLTNRYFRAVAKIGFHYFLTQFPEYTGHEQIFSGIRQFILDETALVDSANTFIGNREHALMPFMPWPMPTAESAQNGSRPADSTRPLSCATLPGSGPRNRRPQGGR
jgi:hypothetical protein